MSTVVNSVVNYPQTVDGLELAPFGHATIEGPPGPELQKAVEERTCTAVETNLVQAVGEGVPAAGGPVEIQTASDDLRVDDSQGAVSKDDIYRRRGQADDPSLRTRNAKEPLESTPPEDGSDKQA